ncbi:MAG: aminotransferase class I/II-fold pyridoxal phosphate-dependent enzyme, partial [Paracoccaceae bacterium]
MSAGGRDHGGGIDAASARFGGARADWLDLSTGINPVAYPLPNLDPGDWRQLPDTAAIGQATEAARRFWNVPEDAEILAAPGVSALIARIPALRPPQNVEIRSASYNEHAAAFSAHGWRVGQRPAPSRVIVHPDNPDGALWDGVGAPAGKSGLLVIDESFCDTCPKKTHVAKTRDAGTIVLKSFGKFWGLAGVRLGFAIGQAETLAPLVGMLGPWAVSGPALR